MKTKYSNDEKIHHRNTTPINNNKETQRSLTLNDETYWNVASPSSIIKYSNQCTSANLHKLKYTRGNVSSLRKHHHTIKHNLIQLNTFHRNVLITSFEKKKIPNLSSTISTDTQTCNTHYALSTTSRFHTKKVINDNTSLHTYYNTTTSPRTITFIRNVHVPNINYNQEMMSKYTYYIRERRINRIQNDTLIKAIESKKANDDNDIEKINREIYFHKYNEMLLNKYKNTFKEYLDFLNETLYTEKNVLSNLKCVKNTLMIDINRMKIKKQKLLIQYDILFTLKLLLLKIKNNTTNINNFCKEDYAIYTSDLQRKEIIIKNYPSHFTYTPIIHKPIFHNVNQFAFVIENINEEVKKLLLQKKNRDNDIYELLKQKTQLQHKYKDEIEEIIQYNNKEIFLLEIKLHDLKNIHKNLLYKIKTICYNESSTLSNKSKIDKNVDNIYNKYHSIMFNHKYLFLYKKLTTLQKLKHIELLVNKLLTKNQQYKTKYTILYKHINSCIEKAKKEQNIQNAKLTNIANKNKTYNNIILQQNKIRIIPKRKINLYKHKIPDKHSIPKEPKHKDKHLTSQQIDLYYKEQLSY